MLKNILSKWAFPLFVLVGLIIFLVFADSAVVYAIKNYYKKIHHPGRIDEQTTAAIGNTLSGTVGLVIAAIASYLTFLAFWVQYTANKQQRLDLRVERFENKFYEMLRIHRDNVDQISLNNNVSGRKTFSRIFNELRFIYYYCVNNIKEQKKEEPDNSLSDDKIYNIAYLIFFFGVGQTSSKLVADILGDENSQVFKNLSECIHKTQDFYRKDIKRLTLKTKVSDKEDIKFYCDYVPFQGHMGNLSHYVRHIFHLVRFVEKDYPFPKNTEAKNNYITTIRSQLSTYEQAFLYYNALSVLGQPWLDDKKQESSLLRKYPIVKSLPKPLADFYKTPDKVFGSDEKNEDDNILFEWTEIKKRYKNIDKKENHHDQH